MADIQDFIVGNYRFKSIEDMNFAIEEEKKVKYIEDHMEYEHPQMVKGIYDKCVKNDVFQTVIGYEFLVKLKNYLKKNGFEEDLEAIRVLQRDNDYKKALEQKAKEKENALRDVNRIIRRKLKSAMAIIAVLAVLIILLFIIANTSNKPNILNYERVIVNKYASWEDDLTKRENIIREAEKSIIPVNDAEQITP